MDLFIQLIGFVAVAETLMIFQQPTQKRVLIMKLISDVLWAVHFTLLGAYSAAAIAIIGIARETVFLFTEHHRQKWRILFLAISLASAFLTWKNWFSLLPATASLLSVISFGQKKPRNTKLLAFPISLCMGTYSFMNGSWANVVNEILTVGSAIIGLMRKEKKA